MRTAFAAVSMLLLGAGSLAGPCPDQRECVGLVLAGGGARGAAHVGVIEVMEELKIPVDFIVGTSMGAIIGGMYASGMSPAEMREQLDKIDWEEAFNDHPPRRNIAFRQKQDDRRSLFKPEFGVGKDGFKSPRGLVAGQKLNFILASLLLHTVNVHDFDDLPIPFRAIAVDLVSGEVVVLGEGDVATAIRASMAYPVAFTPVEIDDMLLIDGGVLRNLPADIAVEMGADRMIAVDVGTPFKGMEDAGSAFKVARRTISVMTREGRKDQTEAIREQDLLIVPELEGVTAFENFDDVGIAVERGVEAARASAEQLKAFAVDDATFAAYIERHRSGRRMGDVTIDRVEVTGLNAVSPKRVTRRLDSEPGAQIHVETLNKDLQEVYRIGEFEQVGFGVRDEDGEKTLEIAATEKSWGPWFYRLGASAVANLDGRGEFTANLLVRRPNISPLGGEWKAFFSVGSIDLIDSDFYMPLEYTGSLFVSPRFYGAENADEKFFIADRSQLAAVSRREAGFDVGTKLFTVGELRIGVLTGTASLDPQSEDYDKVDDGVGGWRALFNFDGLDNANFPRSGTSARLEIYSSRSNLGADREYDRLYAQIGHAWKMGQKWTQLASASFGTDLGSDLPAYDAFRLGGFFNLSGLNSGELIGSRMAFFALVTYRKVGEMPGMLGGDLYLGGSLEAGNTWGEGMESEAALSTLQYAGSVWGGVDTLFGPLHLGWGLSEGGRSQWTLLLGRILGANRLTSAPRLGG